MEFLRAQSQDHVALKKREDVGEKEAAWSALLESYGYIFTDELDIELMRATRAGYFDASTIKPKAKAANDRIVASKADGSFETAWNRYHDSFADNQEEVLNELHTSFMKNVQFISPTNLSGTVTLFKDLGRPEQAEEMLQHYMAARQEPRAFYDLEDSPFGGSVQDPDVRDAFKERFDSLEEKRDIKAMLLSLKDGWSPDTIATLAALPVEEYRKALKSAEGRDLRKILSGVLQFDRIVNASDLEREISSRARKALKEIGGESEINARRVRRFGI
jgi:hypothetical protein